MSIPISRDDLKDSIINRKQGNVEGTTTKIKHKDVLLSITFVQSIGDSSSGPAKHKLNIFISKPQVQTISTASLAHIKNKLGIKTNLKLDQLLHNYFKICG